MAGASLSTLLAFVQDATQRDDIDETLIAAINDAILDLTITIVPTEMEKTQTVSSMTAGDEDHTLDSDVLAIESVALTNPAGETKPVRLKRASRTSWILRDRTTTSTEYSRPKYYYRRGNTLYIWPKPDDNDGNNYNMEISYIKHPATLASSSPSTTSDLNAEWDAPTKYRATALTWLRLQSPEMYQFYNAAYAELITNRNTVLGLEQEADQDATFEFANNQ